MSVIRNVAVVGGSGNFGSAIVDALKKAGFSVTAVSRPESSAKFPSDITILKVNFDSVDELTAAFEGQDAVVSVVGTPGLGGQHKLVDAALAAGVKRFLPSEYGGQTDAPGVKGTGFGTMVGGKIATIDYVKDKAKSNPGFTWTGVAIGLALDFCLPSGIIPLDKNAKSATVYDSGNEPLQTVSIAFIGKTVAAVLKKPEQTANRYVNVVEFETSVNELVKISEAVSGSKWTVTHSSSSEEEKIGQEKLAKGDYSAFVNFLRAFFLADGAGRAPSAMQYDNDILGLKKGDLEAFIKKWIKG